MSIAPLLRLWLLGSFQMTRGESPITFPRRKVASLLAYLALHPAPHSREPLATLFWGDALDAQARQSLRVALTILRTTLGAAILLTERDTVQLNPDIPLWVDALAFATENDPDLYGGDLLPGYDDEWIAPQRERLRTLYLQTLLGAVRKLRSHGDYGRAIEIAHKVLALDPAQEQAHQQIIFCFMALGDRSAALRQYELCERALAEELDVSPMDETLALYSWIRQADSKQMAPLPSLTNLPVPLTGLVGRRRELLELTRLLVPDLPGPPLNEKPLNAKTRLLTLTGAGGIGKTRLALQVALELLNQYHEGVWWVELAGLREPALVVQAVANALGVSDAAQQPLLATLLNFVRARRLLLVLDNCEHLLDACAQLAADLLGRGPYLQILATSRAPLSITGEVTWQVSPLPFPQSGPHGQEDDLAARFDSIRLFVERAQAAKQTFALLPHNAATVAAICQRLEGLPLALELAAARVNLLSVEQILARLENSLHLLTGGNRAAHDRQRTLRATLDWSYDLLAEPEQALFRQLALFVGGFDLEAVEAIGASVGIEPAQALDLLAQLLSKSLVLAEEHSGAARYRLLEPVRQYGWERLRQHSEVAAGRRHHANYYLALAEIGEPQLRGAQQIAWLEKLAREHDNMRAALMWCQEDQGEQTDGELGLRLAGALGHFWLRRGYLGEGRRWLTRMLAHDTAFGDSRLRMKALALVGWLSRDQSDYVAAARAEFVAAIDLGRAVADKWNLAFALAGLGRTLALQGDYAPARSYLEESTSLFEELGDRWGSAITLDYRFSLARFEGRREQMPHLAETALRLAQELANPWALAWALYCRATMEFELRPPNYRQAQTFMAESLTLYRQVGDLTGAAQALFRLGSYAAALGDLEGAVRFQEEGLALNQQLESKWGIAVNLGALGDIAWAQGAPGRAAIYWKEALSLYRAIGDRLGAVRVLGNLALLAANQQQPQRMILLASAAYTLHQALGVKKEGAMSLDDWMPVLDPALTSTRQALGDAAFDALWEEGGTLAWEAAVDYAFSHT